MIDANRALARFFVSCSTGPQNISSLLKRNGPFLIFLAALAALCGWLLSHISLLGRVGINVAYREYGFLKSWWMGAGLVFLFWAAVYWMHWVASRRWPRRRRMHGVTAILALLGLYATYADFRHDLSHRWLGERFHLGSYLFWIGLVIISLRFVFAPKQPQPTT